MWNGISLFWGTAFHTHPHHHETLQLVFDIDREFKLKDRNTDWQPFSSAIIEAGHTHQLDSNGSIQLFIYLDRNTRYAKQLSAKYLAHDPINNLHHSDIRKLSHDFFKRLLVTSDCESLLGGCHTILQHLIDIEAPAKVDQRIQRAVSFIANAHERTFRVKDVANHVHLSESRLRHLFKAQVGQPIQNFILWMKVVDSLNLVLKGKPLTQCAYDVGFWDGAHMNRSYRELLGVAPSEVKKYEDDIHIIACDRHNLYSFKTEVLSHWNDQHPSYSFDIGNT